MAVNQVGDVVAKQSVVYVKILTQLLLTGSGTILKNTWGPTTRHGANITLCWIMTAGVQTHAGS
jgi:hypothetical protein